MAEASTEENSTTVDRKLHEIFEEAFDLYNSFETCNDPTNSPEFQAKIKKCMRLFEDCTRLVSIVGMFSSNESYKETPTNDLRYLLLPFFLGQLSQKLCGADRQNIVQVSEEYFNDFLKRCAEYELYEANENRAMVPSGGGGDGGGGSGDMAGLTQMVLNRNAKMEKYRQKKELQDQIKQLKLVMDREQVDDDVKRDFYVKLLKSSVLEAQEEIASIAQEKQILDFQRNRSHLSEHEQRPPRRPVQPLKPIIITKDLAQKAVYGLGYPSFPTMTVSEFYDERVRAGVFPDPNAAKLDPNCLQARAMRGDTAELDEMEDVAREQRQEVDDDEEIMRARARDDWKDEHRRGEGNRYNRS